MAKADASIHATTRYLRVTGALIEEVQRVHREGGDLYRVAPWLAHDAKRVILAVTLDADRAVRQPLRRLLEDRDALEPRTDLKCVAVSGLLTNAPANARGRTSEEAVEERVLALLEAAGRSPFA